MQICEVGRFRGLWDDGEGSDESGSGERELELLLLVVLRTEPMLGHVPRLRCSVAVREGLEAEKTASQREHLSLTALGWLVLGLRMRMGSR